MGDETLIGDGKLDFVDIVKRGRDHWNLWRRRNRSVEPKLAHADLSKIDLSQYNLAEVNLFRANLKGANLERANLSDALLDWAELQGANLAEANCAGARLIKANLEGANLTGASLERANLYNASLRETNLSRANLEGARLGGTSFAGAIYQEEAFGIYIENDSLDDAAMLFDCAKRFTEQLGFSLEDISDWETGSLWRRAKAKVKHPGAREIVADRAMVAENVLLGQQDLQATIELANAAVALENAFKGKKGAVALDLGLFIFLKKSDDGDTFFKRLSVKERALLNKDPSLLGNPNKLFRTIKNMHKLQPKDETAQLDCASDG